MPDREWLALAVLAGIVGAFAHQPLAVAVALLLLLVAYVTPVWARVALRAISYRRRVEPTHVFPGDWVDMTLQIENDKLLPVAWLQIEDENPKAAVWERGHIRSHHLPLRQVLVQMLALGWFQRVTRHYRVRITRRGFYRFGPATLRTGDALGLSEATANAPVVDKLVVYPSLMEPPELPEFWHRLGSERTARQSLVDDPVLTRGCRGYQSSDPWRHVNWRATARTGELQVKLFEPAIAPGLAIFLDLLTYPNPYEGYHPEWLEAAISLAASAFKRELDTRRPAALFCNGFMSEWGAGPRQPLTADPALLPAVLEGLARLLPTPMQDIGSVMEAELARLPRGTVILVVAACAAPSLALALASARHRGYPVMLAWVGDREVPAVPEGTAVIAVSLPGVA